MGPFGRGYSFPGTAHSGHRAEPEFQSWTQEGIGAPADLMNPQDYPLVAICIHCRDVIRTENMMRDWEHIN